MNKIWIAFVSMLLIGGIWFGWRSDLIQSWRTMQQRQALPLAENVNTAVAHADTINAPAANVTTSQPLPAEKNLAIPFMSQAPKKNWDADHEEFCEEAAIAMAGRFLQGRGVGNVDDQEIILAQLKQWELDHVGFYFDTTAAETAQVAEGMYPVRVTLKESPTLQDIESAVAQGYPVIAPTAGRELGNPNFTGPGPVYHMVVIRGYTKDGTFITNDPGTRKGEAYVYRQQTIMDALHDWVPAGERTISGHGAANGRKVILIVQPS